MIPSQLLQRRHTEIAPGDRRPVEQGPVPLQIDAHGPIGMESQQDQIARMGDIEVGGAGHNRFAVGQGRERQLSGAAAQDLGQPGPHQAAPQQEALGVPGQPEPLQPLELSGGEALPQPLTPGGGEGGPAPIHQQHQGPLGRRRGLGKGGVAGIPCAEGPGLGLQGGFGV